MKNIYKKIFIILPMLVFIGMMTYATPARASGILGSVEAWVTEKWDTATTVGKAAFQALKSGGGKKEILEAVGSAAAAALGLLPAHDCPSPILDKQHERPCMFCPMFRVIYMACSGIARTTHNFFHDDVGTLILVFMAVSLALIVLKNVAVMGTRDPGTILNELFTKGFICIAIYLIIKEDYFNILNLTINAIMTDGMKFAQLASSSYESNYTVNLGGSVILMGAEHDSSFSQSTGTLIIDGIYTIEKKIGVLFQYGNFAWCLGTGPERIFKLLPNPVFIIDGLLLYIGGLMFLIGYPWVLADALIQMGIAMALLPFTLAGYAFTGTKNFLGKTFSWILHAIFVFVFMGILIQCILEFVHGIIASWFTNQYEAHDFFTNPAVMAFYSVNMLKLMFLLFLGWVYMPLTRDLASKFSKGSSLTAAAMTGKAVTNAVEQNMKRTATWAGNTTVSGIKHTGHYMARQTGRKPMMFITNLFGHDDGHGNQTLRVGTRLMPKFLTRGLEFKVENVGGEKVLRREFKSLTGRKHVMLADQYTTIKEEYSSSGNLVKREAVFKKEFIRDHLFEKNGQINKGTLKALLDSPLGKNPAYRQAIMEQVAIEKLKRCHKDLGKYFKSRRVIFNPTHPEKIQIIQVDHNDRETHVTFDVNMTTGQTAISRTSRFKHREFSIRKKSELDFYFNNGVVEIDTGGKRKASGKLRREVTRFKYSAAVQKSHDSILVNGTNPVVDRYGAVAADLQSVYRGRPNPYDLKFGMDSILGGTYINGQPVSEFMVQNILREGTVRNTNQFTTDILQHII